MKKRKVLFVCNIIIIASVIFSPLRYVPQNKNIKPINIVSNLHNYQDIKLILKNSIKETEICFEIPQNNSFQDYNTYYGNKILILLDKVDEDNIKKYVEKTVSQYDFMEYTTGDVFEGVEKLYYLQKLVDSIDKKYQNSTIKNEIKYLLENNYVSEGYFYYEEFDAYINGLVEKEILTIKLYHIMITLFLCYEYELTYLLNVVDIKNYIDYVLEMCRDINTMYYAYLSYLYMGLDIESLHFDFSIIDIDSLDILEMNALVILSEKYDIDIDRDLITEKMLFFIEDCRMSNLLELYVAIETLTRLDVSIKNKDEILSLVNIYMNKDGTFPRISYLMPDNKQLLMHYEMCERMGIDVDINAYKNLLIDNFYEQDFYDLYSYSFFAIRLGLNIENLQNHLLSILEELTIDSKSSIGYVLLAISELGVEFKKEKYISNEILEYINLITSSETIKLSIDDLILLYGAASCGLLKKNDSLIKAINDVDLECFKEVKALAIYYKYSLIEILQKRQSENKKINLRVASEIEHLRCMGGFKMSKEDNLFDLQATYFIIKLLP